MIFNIFGHVSNTGVIQASISKLTIIFTQFFIENETTTKTNGRN